MDVRLTSAHAGFRPVPRTGVIYVMAEAERHGWVADHPDWVNLGQGAPEIGPLPGAPPRIESVAIDPTHHEYAPVGGTGDLRDAVAHLYNQRYRVGKRSQYTRENVSISAGGRLALTRIASTLGRTHVGHFLPDYTAYEELLGTFATFVPIPILLEPERRYAFSADLLEAEILGRGLGAVLLSNPCNPTGKLIAGAQLGEWVGKARSLGCTLILDEFYSHYVYVGDATTVSAAAHVDDVDADPVLIVDGLTKNFRYPGWRVAWTVGPRDIIAGITSAGSFLDGGCPHPLQRAAMPLLDPADADAEARAIQAAFRAKRNVMLDGLEALGIRVDPPPQGGFYCWGDLSRLPEPLRTGMGFFRAALDHRVIVVPGEFFDINPGRRRAERPSRFRSYARFSFGPSMESVRLAMRRLEELVRGHA